MSKKFLLDLQRFAEGAAAGEGTGEISDDADQKDTAAQVDPEELFGEGAEETETQSNQNDADAPKEETFDDLINGRFKKDFNTRVSGIVKERVKNYQENLNKQNSIMSLLAEKYGIDGKNVDELEKAILEDDSYYEAEAMEKGVDVKTLKHIKKLERENQQFAENIREMEKQQQDSKAWANVLEQAEEVKKLYPDFDIESEMQDKTFGMLVAANVPVKTAFEAVHHDELQPQMMKLVADKTAEKVANSVKSNKKRPQEGTGNAQPLHLKKSVASLTDAERDEINRRVLNGEIVYI